MGESRLKRLRAQQDLEASVGLQTVGGPGQCALG